MPEPRREVTTHELRTRPAIAPGVRLPLTERQLAYRLYRVTMELEELIELVTDYHMAEEWPVDEAGYPDVPSFIWSAYMMQVDVTDAKRLLEVWQQRDNERTRKGTDERADLA